MTTDPETGKASSLPVEDPPPQPQADEIPPPPDGGIRAWTQVLACHLINALTWGQPASFGVYQLYYTETLNLPPSQVSWVGSIQVFLTFFLCAFSGRAADAGYTRYQVSIGLFLVLFGTFMTSLCTQYWQILLAQGICNGIGSGMIFMPAVYVVGTYFSTKKSMALAISASGTGTGSLVFPSTVQYLIPQIGFDWAVRSAGLIATVFGVIILALLKPRLPPRKSGPLIEWSAFKEPSYTLFSIGVFLVYWALYFGFFYINTYARQVIGFGSVTSVNLLLITNAAGMPTRPLLGWVADRWVGPQNTFVASTFGLGCVFFIWIAISTKSSMYVFAVLYGAVCAAAMGIFVGALVSLTKDLSKTGTRFGMVCSILAFASLTGPPIAGALIQSQDGDYTVACLWAGAVTLAGCGTLVLSRVCETGWVLRVKK